MGKKNIVTINNKYGRLTAITNPYYINQRAKVDCICDCGNKTTVCSYKLRTGWTQSCGCFHEERFHAGTHRLTKTPIYALFRGMKARCYNKNFPKYQRYGARGIKIDNEWLNDFKTFYDWALANGWQKGLTIERIDNDGNYEPSNCKFIIPKEQARNKSTTKLSLMRVKHMRILYNISGYSVKDIAYLYGVNYAHANRVIKTNNLWN